MSDKKVDRLKGWTLVTDDGDAETSDSSTGSADFVHVENDEIVSFHHRGRSTSDDRSRSTSKEPEFLEDVPSNLTGSISPSTTTQKGPDDHDPKIPITEDLQQNDVEDGLNEENNYVEFPPAPSPMDPDVEVGPHQEEDGSSARSSSPGGLDLVVVSALTSGQEALTRSSSLDDASDEDRVQDDMNDAVESLTDSTTSSDSDEAPLSVSPPNMTSVATSPTLPIPPPYLEQADHSPRTEDSLSGDDVELLSEEEDGEELLSEERDDVEALPEDGDAPAASVSSSSEIEHLNMLDDEEMFDPIDSADENHHEDVSVLLPQSITRLQAESGAGISESESESSDIVRLDSTLADDLPSTSYPTGTRSRSLEIYPTGYCSEPRRYFPAADLMQVSASSSTSSGSNASSRFHFIQPLPKHRYVYHREEDDQSLAGDVDDRCESDISGVAHDSDPDLSTMSYDLDELDLLQGDVVRSYKHRPNSSLNSFLTMLAMLTLSTTIGVGIGHYLGTARKSMVQNQQAGRMMEIQDEYQRCLRQQDILTVRAAVTDHEKIAAVTAIWKEKYEELIIEKVELETLMKQLKIRLSDDINNAQDQILSHKESTQGIKHDLDELQYDLNMDLRQENKELRKAVEKNALREAGLREAIEHQARREDIETQALREAMANQAIHEAMENVQLKNQALHEDIEKYKRQETEIQLQNQALLKDIEKYRDQEIEMQLQYEALREDIEKYQLQETEMQQQINLDQDKVWMLRYQVLDLRQRWERLEQRKSGVTQEEFEDSSSAESDVGVQVDLDEGSQAPHDLDTEQYYSLQDEANALETENQELRQQVARLRYSKHQQVAVDDSSDHPLKQEVNRLANENIDLKKMVVKLRYGQQMAASDEECTQATDRPVTDQTLSDPPSVNDEATQTPESPSCSDTGSDPPSVNDEAAQTPESPSCSDTKPSDLSSFLTYLSLLLPANFPEPISVQLDFMRNVTGDLRFMETMTDRWHDLKDVVSLVETHVSDSTADIRDEVQRTFEDMQQTVSGRWKQFQDHVYPEKFEEVKETATNKFNDAFEIINNSSAMAKYQEFVNKTKESVSKLTKKIDNSWSKVKNLTGDFLDNNKALKKFGKRVNKGLKKIGKSLESGWNKAQKHLTRGGWLPESWGTKNHHQKHHNKDKKQAKTHNKETEKVNQQYENHQQQHTDYNDELHGTEGGTPHSDHGMEHGIGGSVPRRDIRDRHQTADHFAHKPHHKQTQSSDIDMEVYEEYWRLAEFEPDDFLQEGFFENNNREWFKHQKRVHKLHGRLHRLNQDIFLAMDDDDIEDLYEDFEDLQDDGDKVEQPETLMTWLTCQVRWWKSRLYRKHSNEDLVKGCGHHLMKWQLTALCNIPCGFRKCRKQDTALSEGPFCEYYNSMILPFNEPKQSGANQDNNQGNIGHRQVVTVTVDDANQKASGLIQNAYGQLRYEINVDGADEEVARVEQEDANNKTETVEDLKKDQSSQDAAKEDSTWVFERAEDRESFHHNGMWHFKRNKVRNFERTKPWYYKRADHRANLRTMAKVKPDGNCKQGEDCGNY